MHGYAIGLAVSLIRASLAESETVKEGPIGLGPDGNGGVVQDAVNVATAARG
jgi:hypothetical protein